jgi:hypothetical protein
MIIGICGFQSSGKDTIADFLIKEYGFKKMSFAGALKDIVSIMFGWSRDKLEGLTKEDRIWREQIDPWWSRKLNKPLLSPRYVLQYFGTDLFRNNWNPDIWVHIMENKLCEFGSNVVITDCRFENEIQLINRLGGKIIQVHRNIPKSIIDTYRLDKDSNMFDYLHISEKTWIKCYCDYEIENNGTIEELNKKVENIIFKTT